MAQRSDGELDRECRCEFRLHEEAQRAPSQRGGVFVPVGHQDPAETLSRRPDYGIVKSGTADAAMLPVLQNLIRDQESESECSARDTRESGSLV